MSSQDWATATAPGKAPIINSIYDFSAESLGQLKVWLEQAGLNLPISNIIGYKTSSVRIYQKSSTPVTVSNTTTETDVVNTQIPGGSMDVNGCLRVTLVGDYLNNSGGATNCSVKFYLGSTLLDTVAVGGIASQAARYPASYELFAANKGAVATQTVAVNFPDFSTTAAGQVRWFQHIAADTTVDTSVSQTLRVTVKHDTASANVDYRMRYYMIEFL